MNTFKKTVSIILALIVCFAALTAAACKPSAPTPIVNGDPDAAPTASSASKDTSKQSGKDPGRTFEGKLWSLLGDRTVLTVVYNGKENSFTAAALDKLKHFAITASDPSVPANGSKGGDPIDFEGVTMHDLLAAIGLGDQAPKHFSATTASGETVDLTDRLSSISFKRCVFALSSNKAVLDDDKLGALIIVTSDGQEICERYGVVRFDLEF